MKDEELDQVSGEGDDLAKPELDRPKTGRGPGVGARWRPS